MMKYPVMEHFYTIQGEGVHAGKPAYFVRLAGCDVGCVWCDVKESWPTEGYPECGTDEICDWIAQTPAQLAVKHVKQAKQVNQVKQVKQV